MKAFKNFALLFAVLVFLTTHQAYSKDEATGCKPSFLQRFWEGIGFPQKPTEVKAQNPSKPRPWASDALSKLTASYDEEINRRNSEGARSAEQLELGFRVSPEFNEFLADRAFGRVPRGEENSNYFLERLFKNLYPEDAAPRTAEGTLDPLDKRVRRTKRVLDRIDQSIRKAEGVPQRVPLLDSDKDHELVSKYSALNQGIRAEALEKHIPELTDIAEGGAKAYQELIDINLKLERVAKKLATPGLSGSEKAAVEVAMKDVERQRTALIRKADLYRKSLFEKAQTFGGRPELEERLAEMERESSDLKHYRDVREAEAAMAEVEYKLAKNIEENKGKLDGEHQKLLAEVYRTIKAQAKKRGLSVENLEETESELLNRLQTGIQRGNKFLSPVSIANGRTIRHGGEFRAAEEEYWEHQKTLGSLRNARAAFLYSGLKDVKLSYRDKDGKLITAPVVEISDVILPAEINTYFSASKGAPNVSQIDPAWELKINVPERVLVEALALGKITPEQFSLLKINRKSGGATGPSGGFYGIDGSFTTPMVSNLVDATPQNNTGTDYLAKEFPLGSKLVYSAIGAIGHPTGNMSDIAEHFKNPRNFGMRGPGGRGQAWVGYFANGGVNLPARDPKTGLYGLLPEENIELREEDGPAEIADYGDRRGSSGTVLRRTPKVNPRAQTQPKAAPDAYPVYAATKNAAHPGYRRYDENGPNYHVLPFAEKLRDVRDALRAHYDFQRYVERYDSSRKPPLAPSYLEPDPTYDPKKAKRVPMTEGLSAADKSKLVDHRSEAVRRFGKMLGEFKELAEGRIPGSGGKAISKGTKDPEYRESLRVLYGRLKEIHEVLEADGYHIPELPEVP